MIDTFAICLSIETKDGAFSSIREHKNLSRVAFNRYMKYYREHYDNVIIMDFVVRKAK